MNKQVVVSTGYVQRFRGGLVSKAHRLCVSLNSRLESKKEEEEKDNRLWRAREAHRDEGRAALCEARGPNFHLVLGFGLSCFGLSGFGFRVSGFGLRVSGFGFQVLGFGFQVWSLAFGV